MKRKFEEETSRRSVKKQKSETKRGNGNVSSKKSSQGNKALVPVVKDTKSIKARSKKYLKFDFPSGQCALLFPNDTSDPGKDVKVDRKGSWYKTLVFLRNVIKE